MTNSIFKLTGMGTLVIMGMVLATLLFSCESSSQSASSQTETASDTTAWKYVCVHQCPGGHSNEPGKCPACGMDMLEASKLKK